MNNKLNKLVTVAVVGGFATHALASESPVTWTHLTGHPYSYVGDPVPEYPVLRIETNLLTTPVTLATQNHTGNLLCSLTGYNGSPTPPWTTPFAGTCPTTWGNYFNVNTPENAEAATLPADKIRTFFLLTNKTISKETWMSTGLSPEITPSRERTDRKLWLVDPPVSHSDVDASPGNGEGN